MAFCIESMVFLWKKWLCRGFRDVTVSIGRKGGGGGWGGVTPPPPPPKFIRSKIFLFNLWQLYYSDSTVFKFCTSMWLFSALAPALYKGCGLLAAIIFFILYFFSQINFSIVDHLYDGIIILRFLLQKTV